MILSFSDAETQRLWQSRRSRRLPSEIVARALLKLEQLEMAIVLDDLRIPPSNHLEALVGDRTGQHSIRINRQWRGCFTWTSAGAAEVAILDYH